jgi:oligopeptide transport system substrate-binding protein
MLKPLLTLRSFLVFFGVAFLFACSNEPNETRVEQGTREGVLHFGNGTEIQGLDPHIVTGVPEHHVLTALFEGLVLKNPYTLEIEPGVAESWDISEDGRIYTFKLRQDAYWSNGDQITSEDFLWSWQRAITPELGSQYNYMYFPIVNAEAFATGEISDFGQVGAKALDPFTFEVTLNEPTPYILQIFDHYSTFPVHRATIEAFGSSTDQLSQWARVGNIVTNGAFELTEWEINSHVRVEKRASYWDADVVKLNAIVFYPTENITTEERMFRDGQLHRTEDVPVDKVSVYTEENPEVFKNELYNGSYYYNVNTTREPFDDVRVRRALALSVDRDLISSSIMQGASDPSISVVPPGSPGYSSPVLIGYDPDLARQLLAEAGFPNGEGFPAFDILYNTHESHRKIAVAIQQMWNKELNIPVTISNQEWKVYLDTMAELNFDLSRQGWIGDYVDPYNFLDLFITDGGNNRTGWSNLEYDQIVLRDAPAERDAEKRSELYFQAETMLLTELPVIPIYTYKTRHLVSTEVKGLPHNVMDYYNYKYVYLEASE